MTTLLISEEYVKTNSGLDDNVYSKFLFPAIREAQEMGLQTIIGTSLYTTITGMVNTNTIVEEDDYKYLLDTYIQPYLLYQTIVNLIPVVGTKIGNIGTVITTDEHTTNITKNERDLLADYYQFRADFYCRRLQKYLCNNRSKYPELRDCDCNQIKANLKSAATCPIWLGGRR
jgi:hypothetical protein